jgi:riboflavin kinase
VMSKEYEVLPLLLELAKRSCLTGPKRISKVDVLKSMGVTSWKLRKLLEEAENEGYLEKRVYGRRVFFVITQRGRELLSRVHDDLRRVLYSANMTVLKGQVVPGIGEGAIYMSIPNYIEAFKEILGFEPYPGTLNIRLFDEDVPLRQMLRERRIGFRIEPIKTSEGEYGGVTVYKAIIMGNGVSVSGGALDIDKTKHGDEILEVIAPVRLRDELHLKDNDTVEVTILG